MRMKATLTFACLNMKKLAKILWKIDLNGGLLLEKLSRFYTNLKNTLKANNYKTNPGKTWVCLHSDSRLLPRIFLFIQRIQKDLFFHRVS